ncbi:hypothetical protein L2D14_06725 [Thalassospiraceae bacterium LMO-JJ14]|nr:hypothetical protein L2D14_06725 [Thalassospiraceae bacterium LMO-JJ14]
MPADDPVRKLALAALDADAQARDLLDASAATATRLAVSVLYRYASDLSYELSPADAQKLASDDAAQADLAGLIAANAFAYMPRQAAAASGAVSRRESGTAVLTLTPSQAEPGQVYLGIELFDPEAPPPVHLFIRHADGPWRRIQLPPFSGARAQMLLDATGETASALADPETEVYLR